MSEIPGVFSNNFNCSMALNASKPNAANPVKQEANLEKSPDTDEYNKEEKDDKDKKKKVIAFSIIGILAVLGSLFALAKSGKLGENCKNFADGLFNFGNKKGGTTPNVNNNLPPEPPTGMTSKNPPPPPPPPSGSTLTCPLPPSPPPTGGLSPISATAQLCALPKKLQAAFNDLSAKALELNPDEFEKELAKLNISPKHQREFLANLFATIYNQKIDLYIQNGYGQKEAGSVLAGYQRLFGVEKQMQEGGLSSEKFLRKVKHELNNSSTTYITDNFLTPEGFKLRAPEGADLLQHVDAKELAQDERISLKRLKDCIIEAQMHLKQEKAQLSLKDLVFDPTGKKLHQLIQDLERDDVEALRGDIASIQKALEQKGILVVYGDSPLIKENPQLMGDFEMVNKAEFPTSPDVPNLYMVQDGKYVLLTNLFGGFHVNK